MPPTSWMIQQRSTPKILTVEFSPAALDSGLIFERDLELNTGSFIQTLEPRLYYLYNEYQDQTDIPVFDSTELTFGMNQLFRENRFSGKDRMATPTS